MGQKATHLERIADISGASPSPLTGSSNTQMTQPEYFTKKQVPNGFQMVAIVDMGFFSVKPKHLSYF
jgi:hypothetical protein